MKQRYCICRSTDSSGFMLSCDGCDEWFHGKCVSMNKKAAKAFDKWYCPDCKRKELAKQPKQQQQQQEQQQPPQPAPQQQQQQQQQIPLKPIAKRAGKTRAPNQKTKSKSHARKQCANPQCVFESRADSKYCSEDCGYEFNKLRYETHYVNKWRNLEKNHSQARLKRMIDLEQLEKEMADVKQLIKNLKSEKEELEQNIIIIKEKAKKLCKENAVSKENEDEDAEMDNDDNEEIISGDISKTFCITCGHTIMSHKAFSHWASCHKKHEGSYNFTADVLYNPKCEEDENPKLYCHHQDKKTKRYCMHIESACPQHSNWQSDKDEVCGCPLNIMQKLVPDGSYCLELKKDCTQHYHWDKFRLAQINMQRVHAFSRFESIRDKIAIAKENLADTYGGVVGVMLHNTVTESN